MNDRREKRAKILVPLAISIICLSVALPRVAENSRVVDLLLLFVSGMLLGVFLTNLKLALRSN